MLKVKKTELGRALGVLAKMISTTSTMPVCRSVLFAGSCQTLQLTGTNGDERVTMELPVKSDGDFRALLEFSDLRDLLKGSRPGELTFAVTDHGVSVSENIQGHEISRVLAAHDPESFPEQEPIPDEAARIELPAQFLTLARNAATIVDRRSVRPVLSGINLSCDGITSTDGKQLINLPCPLALEKDLTLPFPLALLIAKPVGAGLLQVWNRESQTCFSMTIGDFAWRGRMLPGSFPDWKQVIPGDEALDSRWDLSDESAAQLREFLKRIPDRPPQHAVQIEKIADGMEVRPVGFPDMKIVMPGGWSGAVLRVPLTLNKYTLLRMLQLEFKTIQMHSGGDMPIVAGGPCGRFVAMPTRSTMPRTAVKISAKPIPPTMPAASPATAGTSEIRIQPQVVPEKEKASMPPLPVTQESAPRGEGMIEELGSSLDEFRGKLKALFDQSAVLARKLKEAAVLQKQKERELQQARRAIERIKVASGF